MKHVHLLIARVRGPEYVLCTGTTEKMYRRAYGKRHLRDRQAKLVFTFRPAEITCLRCKELHVENQLSPERGRKPTMLVDEPGSLTEEEKRRFTVRIVPWLEKL